MTLYAHKFNTAVSPLCAVVEADRTLIHLLFAHERDPEDLLASIGESIEWNAEPCREVERQIDEYVRGERRSFDLRIAPRGTDFQRRVWDLLREIPFGETRTYGEIAHSLGKPGSSRAVGGANGANPIVIVIPCHRVIGTDGSLTGFGGGIEAKRALLALEGQRTLF